MSAPRFPGDADPFEHRTTPDNGVRCGFKHWAISRAQVRNLRGDSDISPILKVTSMALDCRVDVHRRILKTQFWRTRRLGTVSCCAALHVATAGEQSVQGVLRRATARAERKSRCGRRATASSLLYGSHRLTAGRVLSTQPAAHAAMTVGEPQLRVQFNNRAQLERPNVNARASARVCRRTGPRHPTGAGGGVGRAHLR